jgi:hypothetical protein
MGIDHANYSHANEAIADHTRKALIADFA